MSFLSYRFSNVSASSSSRTHSIGIIGLLLSFNVPKKSTLNTFTFLSPVGKPSLSVTSLKFSIITSTFATALGPRSFLTCSLSILLKNLPLKLLYLTCFPSWEMYSRNPRLPCAFTRSASLAFSTFSIDLYSSSTFLNPSYNPFIVPSCLYLREYTSILMSCSLSTSFT